MRSLIYGYGDTGKSFERYLKDKKIDFDIFDSNIAEHNQKKYGKPNFFGYTEKDAFKYFLDNLNLSLIHI